MHAARVLLLLSVLAALLSVALAQGNSGNNGNGNGNGNNNNRPQQPSRPVNPPPTTNNNDDAAPAPPPSRNTNNRTPAQPQTRQEEDACESGVCQAPNGRGRCLLMEKTTTCKGFKNLWLPLNVTKYFENRFPLKRTDLIPQFGDIQNKTTFDWFIANNEAPWSRAHWWGKYRDEYMIKIVGCNVPTQQWYKTWICLDILKWAVEESGSPCSRGQQAPICKSTMDERILSLERDVYNATTCSQHPKIREVREKHLQSLRTFPWISTSTNCISGQTNEEDISQRTCGLSLFVACSRPDLCPPSRMSVSNKGGVKAACQGELSNAVSSSAIKLTDPLDKDVNRAPLFASIGMGVLALLALIAGLAGLNNIRSRGAKLEAAKEAQRMKEQEAAAAAVAAAKKNKNGSGSIPGSQAGSSSTTNLLAGASLPPTPIPPLPQQYGAVPHTPQPYGGAPAAVQQPMLTGTSAVSSNSSYGLPTPAQQPAMAPEPIIATRQATMPFGATQPDEISLQPGDTVDVFQRFDDGWARGRSRSSGATGFFPYACIQPQQQQPQMQQGGGYGGRYESMGRRGGR